MSPGTHSKQTGPEGLLHFYYFICTFWMERSLPTCTESM